MAGDSLSVTGIGAFTDKNAGVDKNVTIAGLALGGADAGNYTLGQTIATTTADIARATLTLSGLMVSGKTYDGTADATISNVGTLTGVISGDDVSSDTSGIVATFADKNAGTGKVVTVNGITLSGADARNYTINVSATADIDRAVISSVTGVTAQNKIYDGTTLATLDASNAAFTGIIAGDTLVVSGAAAFVDKNAGDGKTVNITGLTLGGADAQNYTLANTTAVTAADIAKAVITDITGITAAGKTYDGATAATLDTSGAVFAGFVAGDDLTVASATGAFADKNAGNGKTVNITDVALGGADAGNYTLASTTAATAADISKAVLTLLGLTVENKTYDGTIAATISNAGMLSGVISGESVSADMSSAFAAFSDKNAGTGKSVRVSGITLSGADAGNYTINGSVATSADIDRAVISAITGITANDKVYDGTTVATLDASNAVFNGGIAGDSLTVASATGAFADANPGQGKTVTITGIVLGGLDAGNYVLTDPLLVTSSADINVLINPPLTPLQMAQSALPDKFAAPTAEVLSEGPELIDLGDGRNSDTE